MHPKPTFPESLQSKLSPISGDLAPTEIEHLLVGTHFTQPQTTSESASSIENEGDAAYQLQTLATVAETESKQTESSSSSSPISSPPHTSPIVVISESSSSSSSSKKKEGLEEATVKLLKLLQTRGPMLFQEIVDELALDYRRVYDILNVLCTTVLVVKRGKKRDHTRYHFFDGKQLPEPVDIKSLPKFIEIEQQKKRRLEEENRQLALQFVCAEARAADSEFPPQHTTTSPLHVN